MRTLPFSFACWLFAAAGVVASAAEIENGVRDSIIRGKKTTRRTAVQDVGTGIGITGLASESSSSSSTATRTDPCQVMDDDFVAATQSFLYVTPTYFERCMESLPMDVNNTLDHLFNLNGIFSQFHCFYNLAKDPDNSEPMSYQPELGYTIAGEGEGQVDIFERMNDLYVDVYSDQAANISTFWSMNAIFQELRDGHVGVPPVSGEDFVVWRLRVFPDRVFDRVVARTSFSFSSTTGDLQLKILWQDENFVLTENTVERINGTSVHDFMVKMANTHASGLQRQSLGARLNTLFKLWDNDFAFFLFPLTFNTKPADVPLPESFSVTYTDGSAELYRTAVLSTGLLDSLNLTARQDVYDLIDRPAVEERINNPGMARVIYSETRGKIVDAIRETYDEATGMAEAVSKRTMKGEKAPKTKQADSAFDFDFIWYTSNVQIVDGREEIVRSDVAGYTIEDDYAVLKIGTFLVNDFGFIHNAWADMAAAAKARGVTKLIVDISENGGGYGFHALSLAASMFPHIEYDWFSHNLDQNYNAPMSDYVHFVEPVLSAFEEIIESWDNDLIATKIEGLSDDQKTALNVTARGLERFCHLNTFLFCSGLACEEACQQLTELADEAENLLLFPTPPAYLDVWSSVFTVARELSAWTTTLAGRLGGMDYTPVTVVRGGVEHNVTQRSSLLSYEQYNEAALKALQVQHTFDEYIIVSDGTAASASSIFASSVEQIWKNRDRSGATSSVVTVAYGGSGRMSDLTIAGIPASVENIRLDNAFYTTFSLLLIPMLLPLTSDDLRDLFVDLVNSIDMLDRNTFQPSYFAQTLPRMPVQNYYDPFMDPGALPLQYVKMPPDEYIQMVLVGTSFVRSQDLSTLYTEASKFFSASSTSLGGDGGIGVSVLQTKLAKEAPVEKSEEEIATLGLPVASASGTEFSFVSFGFAVAVATAVITLN